MCWQKYCYEGTSSLNWVLFQALQLLSRLSVFVGSDAIQKKRKVILDSQQKLIESTLLKKVQQEKDMYLIKRTKAVIAVLNTPDITNSKDYHPLQQSSIQSAKMYFEMKFTTDTRTSYSTCNCKLLTDVKESLSTMQSGTCFQTSDLVLPEKKFQTKLGSLVFPEVSVNVFSSLSPHQRYSSVIIRKKQTHWFPLRPKKLW